VLPPGDRNWQLIFLIAAQNVFNEKGPPEVLKTNLLGDDVLAVAVGWTAADNAASKATETLDFNDATSR
jgi:hypothetical protein